MSKYMYFLNHKENDIFLFLLLKLLYCNWKEIISIDCISLIINKIKKLIFTIYYLKEKKYNNKDLDWELAIGDLEIITLLII